MSNSSITKDEREFLDENGYIVLRNALTPNELKLIKSKISELFNQEGVRAGGIIDSEFRKKWQAKNNLTSKLKLKLFDTLYLCIKKPIDFIRSKVTSIDYVLRHIERYPNLFYSAEEIGLKSEIKNMFISALLKEEKDVKRLCNLVNKGKEFEVLYTHPKVTSVLKHLISDYKLSSLNIRAPKKDCQNQCLHTDWLWSVEPNDIYASNCLWMLDDITLENGPTRVIPGSHKWNRIPREVMTSTTDKHQDEIYVTGKAGDVLIVNSHVWHGGTNNISGKERTLAQAYFVHRAHHPQQQQRYVVSDKVKSTLTEEQLRILDIPIVSEASG